MGRTSKKELMSGNEAVARGAYEAGAAVATGYPGTPATEILQALAGYRGVYAEWSVNEKVALEVASGASIAGARALVAMKHVGVNVAADPLMTLSYTGVGGGLVIVTADDPGHHSSQNEQDNRNYAAFSKMPMLEPSDSAEALEFTKLAFDISEEFDTPVFVRTTTRVSHSKSPAAPGRPARRQKPGGPPRSPEKYVMIPGISEARHELAETRLENLKRFAERFSHNRAEYKGKDTGIITSGISYQYVREAMPGASVLKLGMCYPLPAKKIARFASRVKRLYVVEELDPFLELQIKGMGIEVAGKLSVPGFLPLTGELGPDTVAAAFLKPGKPGAKKKKTEAAAGNRLPERPPCLCPGCPHRGVFFALNKHGYFVAGDIGCYTLAHARPLSSVHTTLCMGAGVGQAHGILKAMGADEKTRVAAVIGDSTFMHSGLTPLMNTHYNNGAGIVIILDNMTTAMTGMQPHPGTGITIKGERGGATRIEDAVMGLGIEDVTVVDPYDLPALERLLEAGAPKKGPKVIIARRGCVLIAPGGKARPLAVIEERCNACGECMTLACPAVTMDGETAAIEAALCTGCGLCVAVCKRGAVKA